MSWIPGPVRLCPGWGHTLPDPSPGGGEGMSDCPRQQHGGAREEALILLGLCQVCGDWATLLPRREGGTCGSRLHSGL